MQSEGRGLQNFETFWAKNSHFRMYSSKRRHVSSSSKFPRILLQKVVRFPNFGRKKGRHPERRGCAVQESFLHRNFDRYIACLYFFAPKFLEILMLFLRGSALKICCKNRPLALETIGPRLDSWLRRVPHWHYPVRFWNKKFSRFPKSLRSLLSVLSLLSALSNLYLRSLLSVQSVLFVLFCLLWLFRLFSSFSSLCYESQPIG